MGARGRDLLASIERYEAGLADRFGADLDWRALAEKHALMGGKDVFVFLRATCWRWAECAPDLCPDLMGAPLAPSVGDAHAGNFGLWFDAGARLVWGVNDFDESARLPYALDLTRLCASLILADDDHDAEETAEALLDGYAGGIAAPAPVVLDGAFSWLRKLFVASGEDRRKFWDKLAGEKPAPAPPAYGAPLSIVFPPETEALRIFRRVAGAGSLGRPRFAAFGRWRGGPLAAEIKGAAPSCWASAREPGLAARMASGRFRSPDPSLRLEAAWTLRRLAPNNRKLEFREIERNLRGRLFVAMACDLAAIHADGGDAAAIRADLKRRPSRWLARAARDVADWTRDEHRRYRRISPPA